MAIHYDKRDTTAADGKPVLAVTFYCENEGQRTALIIRSKELPSPDAWVPFDPPEEPRWPSDDRATWYQGPPNCQGNNSAGNVLAQAQHEAAVDGDDCTSGVCLAVRGAND